MKGQDLHRNPGGESLHVTVVVTEQKPQGPGSHFFAMSQKMCDLSGCY